jgi:enoyl-CoA hydratase
MNELVTREDRGRVSVLTLNNPPANGYTHSLHRALDQHVLDLRMDRGTDVIVLRGAGDRFFCAGADIGYLQSLDADQKYAFCLHANETLLRLENTPKLVIAALNGHCVGGGLEIALACDIRIGRRRTRDKPDQIGLPEVSLGVLPGTGGTQRLSRVLGRARALQWMVEGRRVAMEDALDQGLIHLIYDEDDWFASVLNYARSFCRPERSASAVGLIKRAVLGGADLPLEAGLALERELQMRLFASPDAQEGLSAFIEKRAPRFTGQGASAGVARPSGDPPAEATIPPLTQSVGFARPASRPSPAATTTPPRAVSSTAMTGYKSTQDRGHDDDNHEEQGHSQGAGRTSEARPVPQGMEGFEDFNDLGRTEDPSLPFANGVEAFSGGGAEPTRRSGGGGAGWIDLNRTRIPDAVLNLVPRGIVERYLLVPVHATETSITIAMVDPRNQRALDEVAEETGLEVHAVRADEVALAGVVATHYRA